MEDTKTTTCEVLPVAGFVKDFIAECSFWGRIVIAQTPMHENHVYSKYHFKYGILPFHQAFFLYFRLSIL